MTPSHATPARDAAPERGPDSAHAVLELLTHGELTVRGQIREASNAVLYCTVTRDGVTRPCVYKPVAGERPLWDFPDGTLAQREVAAFEVSRATGWDLVPATVLRDGPYGQGMVQEWIELADVAVVDAEEPGADAATAVADPPPDLEVAHGDGRAAEPEGAYEDADDLADDDGEADDDAEDLGLGSLLAVVEGDTPDPGWKAIGLVDVGEGRTGLLVHADDERLRRLAVLDAVINNGDRKGGHLLPAPSGRLHAIDHGVAFHAENKLRTLLWGWAGEPLTEDARATLERLSGLLADGGDLAGRLAGLITPAELDALRARVAALLSGGVHPVPGGDWPPIPWPPV